jgi:hypothetical protein
MTCVLFIVIAALLLFIGLLIHGVSTWDKQLEGFFSWVTTKMGPGLAYKSSKVFPSHFVWYALSVVAVVLAVILRKH